MGPEAGRAAGDVEESNLRVSPWTDPSVIAVALIGLASGFGQFGAVAALGDVAKSFGQVSPGATIADQAGLSGTVLGVGLAVIRLASLAALPMTGLADRLGRRRLLIGSAAIGLGLTALAAASPSYWWFVVIFACGRPFLSTTNAVAEVSAAEQTDRENRAAAVAMVAAGYGVGAGIAALVHSASIGTIGFRGLFTLALLPLVLLPVIARRIKESDRYTRVAVRAEQPVPVLGAVSKPYRARLLVIAGVAFALSLITGPATSFVFIYAQNIVHLAGWATAIMVVGAGGSGLVGLLIGRWVADSYGRRVSAAIGALGLGVCGVVSYTGSPAALVVGYTLGVLAGSVLAPGVGALVNELFPTEIRASASGWWLAAGVAGAAAGLVTFGALVDAGNGFALAGLFVFVPGGAICAGLLFLIPETRNREPEEMWPRAGL